MSTTEQQPQEPLEPEQPADSSALDSELVRQLAQRAADDGVDLVGPDGLLQQLTKQVLEAGLDVEMSEHLGYNKHEVADRNGENSRNGTRPKTVTTEVGPVEIDARVRGGSTPGRSTDGSSWPESGAVPPAIPTIEGMRVHPAHELQLRDLDLHRCR